MRVMITGASRGIGLEFSRQLAARGEQVFATCRDPAAARDLSALRDEYPDRLSITALDVADPVAIDAACAEISHHTPALDLLINNAGVQPHGERPGTLDAAILMDAFATNAIGPILVAQAFLDLLRGGDRPCIVNITSQMGSLARKSSGGSYSYCGSKAALNMLSKALAYDLRALNIITVMMHPGWVQTDMGGSGASLPVPRAVREMLRTIDTLTLADTARYLQYDGSDLPW